MLFKNFNQDTSNDKYYKKLKATKSYRPLLDRQA
jgi:hypothetical protein